jgi:predicted RNA-binding Zn-ribbon protein involved in translation (DUF1610 family)
MIDTKQLLRSAGIDTTAGMQNGKYECPECGEFGVSVNKNTGRARCYKSGGCGWHYPLRRGEAVTSPIQKALNTIRDDWKRALLTDDGKPYAPCSFRKRAINYLVQERGISPKIVEASQIGMVPNSYGLHAKRIIAETRGKIEANIADKERREIALMAFDEGFAKDLLMFCGEFGVPDHKTGVTSSSREGWIVFFYEDAYGDIIAATFRSVDTDEDGSKIIRMWSPLNRRGVFNPIDGGCTLGGEGDRVLVMEGEFNQLQYLSAHVRVFGDNWWNEVPSTVTAGASSGVDTANLWKVIANIGQPNTLMYAVVNEDNDPAGQKVTQQVAEGGFTYHFILPNKDMDEFIKSRKDDKAALDEVTSLAAAAPLYYCPIDDARARLDTIRCNPPDYANGTDAKGNPLKSPAHILNRNIFNFVQHDIQTRSRLFFSGFAYLYRADTRELVKFINNSPPTTEFLKQYGLMATEDATKLVSVNLEAFLLDKKNVEKMSIHKLGCITALENNTFSCFVNKGDGQMFRITSSTIDVVANGTDDIFMLDEELAEWPDLTDANLKYMEGLRATLGKACVQITNTPLCRHLTSLYEKQSLTEAQCVQMSFARFMFHWVANSCELWPIEFNTGLQNAGKSTGFEKALTLLYGLSEDGEGYKGDNLPPNRRDLIVGLTNSSLKMYDNIDSVDFRKAQSSYLDIFCGCATGMNASAAMLYHDNVQLTYKLKTHLKLTARTCPIQRADAMRRVIQLAIRKPTRAEHVCKSILFHNLMTDRDACLLEILVRLQNMVCAYNQYHTKTYLKVSEMPEYEEWTYRLAEYEGSLPEMKSIWTTYAGMYCDMIQDSNPMAYGMKCWIGAVKSVYEPSNVNRQVSVATLWAEFNRIHTRLMGYSSPYTSPSSFGKHIQNNMSELKALGYADNGLTGGKKRVWFDPTPEQVDECKALNWELQVGNGLAYGGEEKPALVDIEDLS